MSKCEAFYGIGEDYFAERSCADTSAEIAHQPELLEKLAQILCDKKNDIETFMQKTGGPGKVRVVFTGAGSSAFIGDALAVLLAKTAGIRTESVHTTDIVTAPDSHLFADVPTLLVSFARSGNSPESAGAVKYARAIIKDLYEVAVVCDDTSALFNLTSQSGKSLNLVMPEGSNDKGFAMTSSVTCMLLTGYSLFNTDKLSDITADMTTLAQNLRSQAPRLAEAACRWADKDFDRIVYLGCGFLKHIAHEASLKMMELTKGTVNGAFESSTGFRHGPKSVINGKTLTVHMISNDAFTAKYDMDLLHEVSSQQKDNMILAIGASGTDSTGSMPGDETVELTAGGYTSAAADIYTGIEALVFCQMLAMFKSLALKVPTDNPAPGGEVNRVVKGVTIYEVK